MKCALIVFLVIVGVLIVRAIAYSAEMQVTLLPQAEVMTSQRVLLRDLAKISAPKAISRKIGEVVITNAPLPGEQRPLEADYVKLKLSSAGFANIKFIGAAKVTVTGKCIRISSEQQVNLVKEYALGLLPHDGLNYEVAIERLPREMVLPDESGMDVKARAFSSSMHPGVNTIAIEAIKNGETILTRSAVVRIKVTATVVIASDTIAQGQPLTAQNTVSEVRDISKINDPIRSGAANADNWVARRTISAGAIITSLDVALPPAIRSGESVTLTVKCGSVSLRTSAEARQDGRIGDSIRVKSGVSKDDVRARITGPGAVEIVK